MEKRKLTKIIETEQEDDLIPKPTSDIFTAVLWSPPENEPILCSFINAVLLDIGMTPITRAVVLNPFNIKEFAPNKAIILDVRVKDENERWFNIEIQVASHPAFANRVLYYWSDIYTQQLQVGKGYETLRPVISIILTEFAIFPMLTNVHNVFQITAKENPNVLLTDHFQIHFLRLSDVLKGQLQKLQSVCRELRHWLNFFLFGATKTEEEMAVLVENDPIIREAYSELHRFYANDEMREKIRQRHRFLVDYNLGMASSREEGRMEGKIDIARNLKKKGLDMFLIAETTGLLLEEIERLN